MVSKKKNPSVLQIAPVQVQNMGLFSQIHVQIRVENKGVGGGQKIRHSRPG